MSNVKVIIRELKRIGMKDHAIAGVLGNLQIESGYNPRADNGSGHKGLAQWDRSRWSRFVSMAGQKGWGSPTSVAAQAKYLAWEIKSGKGGTSVKRMNQTANIKDAVARFDDEFERSGGAARGERIAAAQQYKGSKILGNAGKNDEPDARTMTWVPSVGKNVTNPFGKANSNYAAGRHTGTDIGGGEGGQKIVWAPPVEGKVIKRSSEGAYGNHVIIRDKKGREWLLAHMQGPGPKVGTRLRQGDKIGNVGNTGNSKGAHLHIEQTEQGESWSYNNVKKPKLVFKVAGDGTVYDGGDSINDSGRSTRGYYGFLNKSADYFEQPGNEQLKEIIQKAKRKGWSQERLDQEIRRSDWAKKRSETQRTFDTSTPVEQQSLLRQAKARVRRTAASLGVVLDKDDLRYEALRVARDGDSDEQLQYWLGAQYEYEPDESTQGFVRDFQENLQDMANNYGFTISEKQMEEWTQDSIQGGLEADSFEDEMRRAAQLRFPDLNLEGRTLREALTPWLSSAAEELGRTYDDFDLTDGKWTDLTDRDTQRMLSDQEWRMKVRTDDRYGWEATEKARQEYGQAAAAVAQLFGGYRSTGGQ